MKTKTKNREQEKIQTEGVIGDLSASEQFESEVAAEYPGGKVKGALHRVEDRVLGRKPEFTIDDHDNFGVN